MLGLADDDQARILGNVHPLVAIDRPGIGEAYAIEQGRVERRERAPQAERSVDVNPGASVAGARAYLFGGIESAGVDVSGLQADDGVVIEWRQGVGAHPSLAVGGNGDHAGATQAYHR